jgi:hypothetical protein
MTMTRARVSRRGVLKGAAAVSAVALSAPFVRGAYAAGKLSVGFWDHWVPGANGALTQLCQEWAAKEKVEVTIDYITSQGNKNLLTIAAESQARSGHDILAFPTWQPADHEELLEPVDDIMTELIKQNGKVNGTVEYLGRSGGKWIAVPATAGSQIKGPCTRIDLLKQHAGIDIQALYPAGAPAEGRRLDHRRLPGRGREVPQGRRAVRHRPRHRPRTRSTRPAPSSRPSARRWSTTRARSRSSPTPPARRSTT